MDKDTRKILAITVSIIFIIILVVFFFTNGTVKFPHFSLSCHVLDFSIAF